LCSSIKCDQRWLCGACKIVAGMFIVIVFICDIIYETLSITEITVLCMYNKSLNKSPKLSKFNTDLKLLLCVDDFITLGKFCWEVLLILFYHLDDKILTVLT